jgi:hypothetical protein
VTFYFSIFYDLFVGFRAGSSEYYFELFGSALNPTYGLFCYSISAGLQKYIRQTVRRLPGKTGGYDKAARWNLSSSVLYGKR